MAENEKVRALPAKWRERLEFGRESPIAKCADELQAALAEQPAGGGVEAPIGYSLRFGMGAFIVNTGTYEGEPAVFVDDAPAPGEVGGKAPDVPAETTPRLRLLFPTMERAKAVADALVNAIPSLPLRDAADMLDPAKQAGVLRRVVDTLPPPARVEDAAVEKAAEALWLAAEHPPGPRSAPWKSDKFPEWLRESHRKVARAALEAAFPQAARPSEPQE